MGYFREHMGGKETDVARDKLLLSWGSDFEALLAGWRDSEGKFDRLKILDIFGLLL